jgi:hypothetical protein
MTEISDPPVKTPHLAIFFKDFAAWVCDASCIGLHVAGHTTAAYLRSKGVDVSVFPVRHNIDVVNALAQYEETHSEPITHAVISAPWLSVYDLRCLIEKYADVRFVILSHSNVGFLQADPGGVELFRKYAELARTHSNLLVGGNSRRFAEWFQMAYLEKSICLPNLYPSQKITSKSWEETFSCVRIGAFGAIRAEKNFMTAAAAALIIRRTMGVPVELHMTTGGEVRHSMTLRAIVEMTSNVDGFTLVDHKWETWDKFITLVATMDLLIQVSYTESFNMITADGISVGVPSVISPVISWAPDDWKADPDDAVDVAHVGYNLLTQLQGFSGFKALDKHNRHSLKYWLRFLNNET